MGDGSRKMNRFVKALKSVDKPETNIYCRCH